MTSPKPGAGIPRLLDRGFGIALSRVMNADGTRAEWHMGLYRIVAVFPPAREAAPPPPKHRP